MNFKEQDDRAHLFLVRLRAHGAIKGGDPASDRWLGTVQRVVSGESYAFCGWPELIECLGAMLDDRHFEGVEGNSTNGGEE